MSTQILASSADTAGLTIDDTSVIKAFAIMAGVGTAFLASAVLAIVSIA